jgi:hypothetical protein
MFVSHQILIHILYWRNPFYEAPGTRPVIPRKPVEDAKLVGSLRKPRGGSAGLGVPGSVSSEPVGLGIPSVASVDNDLATGGTGVVALALTVAGTGAAAAAAAVTGALCLNS